MTDHTNSVLHEIAAERVWQDNRWGQQDHADRIPFSWETDNFFTMEYGVLANQYRKIHEQLEERLTKLGHPQGRNNAWDVILLEEVYEALCEKDPERIRKELVQVAAVAVAWIEAIDRRKS